jgi:hypothetical protein
MTNDELENLIDDICCATFHMNDEQAIYVIAEFLEKHPELLKYYDKEWYYKNC